MSQVDVATTEGSRYEYINAQHVGFTTLPTYDNGVTKIIDRMADRKQTGLKRDARGRITGGTPPAGFNKHPENRHSGAWNKEDTARYKLERIIKMSDAELHELLNDETAPRFDRDLARIQLADDLSTDTKWRVIEGMINQVYGKPKESVDLSNPDGSLTPKVALVEFTSGRKSKRSDTRGV